jgi:hypothetical protein
MTKTTIFRSSRVAIAMVGAVVAPTFAFGQAAPRPAARRPIAPASASTSGPTVFTRALADRATADTAQAQGRVAAPTLRPGEVVAAPYVEGEGGPPNAGRIIGTGDVPGIPLTESERPLQSAERIFIVVPPGMTSVVGTRYVAVRRGPLLEGVGQVMIPTGIVAVQRAQPGQAVEATVVARFEQLFIGDELVSMVNVPRDLPRPTAQTGGAATRVLWTEGEPALPSLQSYILLDGSAARFRPGDQVTLYRERRLSEDGVVLPESEIAVAQVVRVTAQAASAMIVHQSHAAIQDGASGRVTARMP